MGEFCVEVMFNLPESDEFRYMVKQKTTGWFYPNLTKREAEVLCDKFNEVANGE